MAEVILFYRTAEAPYGAFSNFAAFPINVDGQTWPTVEHYYQSQKMVDPEYRERVRQTASPMVAAQIGRGRRERLRADWDEIKVEVMRSALQAKFTQHHSLRELLLGTGEAELIEHTANDAFWADGGDGTGANMLGRLLMELRAVLRADAEPGAAPDPARM